MRARALLALLLAALFAGCGPALYSVSVSGWGANVTLSVDTRGKSPADESPPGAAERDANRSDASARTGDGL